PYLALAPRRRVLCGDSGFRSCIERPRSYCRHACAGRIREAFGPRESCLSWRPPCRSEEHTSELQSLTNLVCRLLLEKKKQRSANDTAPTGPRHARKENSAQHPADARAKSGAPPSTPAPERRTSRPPDDTTRSHPSPLCLTASGHATASPRRRHRLAPPPHSTPLVHAWPLRRSRWRVPCIHRSPLELPALPFGCFFFFKHPPPPQIPPSSPPRPPPD